MASTPRMVLIDYPPSQSYVVSSLQRAFTALLPQWKLATSRSQLAKGEEPDVQWADYDEIDWDEAIKEGRLVNSYVIRKSLIRKNHLAHTLALYLSKNPGSPLVHSTLQTFHFQLSYSDELDELLADDLYELAESFAVEEQGGEKKWWILKAALADKGNGIRLFSTRDELEAIFDEFEEESSDEEDSDEAGDEVAQTSGGYGESTRVSSSQLREWVIQEYIFNPLLLDPVPHSSVAPRKFHLRVYVLAVGGLKVYVHRPYLALFAPTPYSLPSPSDESETEPVDLRCHLTNTCLQSGDNIVVETLQRLADEEILAGPHKGSQVGPIRIAEIERQVECIVGETFKAGVSAGSGFQVLPGSFEIFGLDFLVDDNLRVSLLEINACPDFTQTGAELQTVIDELFASTIQTAVVPFFDSSNPITAMEDLQKDVGKLGLGSLTKVLDMQVSKTF